MKILPKYLLSIICLLSVSICAMGADSLQTVVPDSVILREMALELQEMRQNELALRSELDNLRLQTIMADSIKIAEQRRLVDSLRAVTPGVPVVINADTIFTLYAERGGYSASDRAEMISDNLLKIGKNKRMQRDSVHMLENDSYIDIMYGNKVIVSITDQDALWQGTTRRELAQQYIPILSAKIDDLKENYNLLEIAKRVALFSLVIGVQYLLFRLTNFLFRKLRRRIIRFKQHRLKPVIIRDYELLNTRRLEYWAVILPA